MGHLNELQIKAAQPRDKEYMLSDGEGLYLRVRPNGKIWIYRYKQAGQQAKLSFGSYPAVALAMARRRARDETVRIPVNVTADSGNVTGIPANVTEGRCCAV